MHKCFTNEKSYTRRCYYYWLILTLIFYVLPVFSSPIKLADNGNSDYRIALDANATLSEKNAADRLAYYLKQITNAEYKIITLQSEQIPKKCILVGQSDVAGQLLENIDWSKIPADGIIIKTVGNNLIISGNRPRGTLYAVYSFLEDELGCRWWTPDASYIPKKNELYIPDLDISYSPPFFTRDTYYYSSMGSYRGNSKEREFTVQLKLNGFFTRTPDKWGGYNNLLGWCHTFYRLLLPPEKYFKSHPEWYSLINGKRTVETPQGAQLCLTDELMQKELIAQASRLLRNNPGTKMISISQNDSMKGQCECEKCLFLEKKEQSPSGPLLYFINRVATELKKEFPGIIVETLAYNYTRIPPLNIRPADNVIIRLCTMGAKQNKPISDSVNKVYYDDLKAWSAICDKLYVWNYAANYTDYIRPRPNLHTLGKNLRLFEQNNVKAVFVQGDNPCRSGYFSELKSWVAAHLLWNPNQNENMLIKEFMSGYYGSAGKYLNQYRILMQKSMDKAGILVDESAEPLSYLSLADMNSAQRLFELAKKAVKNDSVLLRRVKAQEISLQYLWLVKYKKLKDESKEKAVVFNGPKDIRKALEDFIKACKDYNIEYFNESTKIDDYIPNLKRVVENYINPAPVPEICKNLYQDDWIEVQNTQFQVPSWCGKTVADPQASNKSAALLKGNLNMWGIQVILGDIPNGSRHSWKVYASMKFNKKSDKGNAVAVGFYDTKKKTGIPDSNKTIKLNEVVNSRYSDYFIGIVKFTPHTIMWFSPIGANDSLKNIYFDRVYFVKQK
jgi:hypothetical protein